MALPQRLNELAAAHSQGLLNDDEYRLLRQDVFQRFSDTTIIPVEAHIIPLESHGHVVPVALSFDERKPTSPMKRQVEFAPSITPKGKVQIPEPPQSARLKQAAISTGVANLFRRATGRKSSREKLSSDYESSKPKRAFIPPMLSRKSNDSYSTRSGSDSLSSFSHSRKTSITSASTLSSPLSPATRDPSASKVNIPAVMNGDGLFEDGDLSTTKDIRQALTELENEGRRLIDAFNDLERSTISRVYKDKPNVRPPLAETSISANWPATPIAPPVSRQLRSVSGSIRSRAGSLSPSKTSLDKPASSSTSLSNSVFQRKRSTSRPTVSPSASFLKPKTSTPSFNSTNERSLKRKGSLSSLFSSHSHSRDHSPAGSHHRQASTPNSDSSNTLLSPSSAGKFQSRSASHLPLPGITESSPRHAVPPLPNSARPSLSSRVSPSRTSEGCEDEVDAEVLDVRRRRTEVIGRYEARMEYLRARLKGAELHEKLLKR